MFAAVRLCIRFVGNCVFWISDHKCADTHYKMAIFYLCIRKIIFVAQIKSPRGAFICAQIEGYKYTNEKSSLCFVHNLLRGVFPPPSSYHSIPPFPAGILYDMTPPPIDDPFPSYDFLSEFLPALDFGESFGFGRGFDFDSAFSASDSSFFGGYDNKSCTMSVEGYVRLGCCCHCRKKHRTNRLYRKESVLMSPWYVNFLCPGITRNLTHELSSSDCFGKFRLLLRMQLSKVEELTDILINRGYIETPSRCSTALETVTSFVSVA